MEINLFYCRFIGRSKNSLLLLVRSINRHDVETSWVADNIQKVPLFT